MSEEKLIEWEISDSPVAYEEALAFMEQRVDQIIAGEAGPCVWFLEHPPLYTAGTSAKPEGLLDKDKFPVYMTGRGGEYTYHGPGQLVGYVMMDLKQLFAPEPPDLKAYIARLEGWIIGTLKEFGVEGFVKPGMIGVWVSGVRNQEPETRSNQTTPPACGGGRGGELPSEQSIDRSVSAFMPPPNPPRKRGGDALVSSKTVTTEDNKDAKIAAIGVRVRKWVAFHGICLNVAPNLDDYQGIVPCGISEFGVTSLEKLGKEATMEEVKSVMRETIRHLYI